MPSFDYQKKIKQEFLEENKLKTVTYFFTEINVFVITERVKYRKKVPLGTFKSERYPTLVFSVTWSFRNHSSMLIYNQCWKKLYCLIFFGTCDILKIKT